MPAPLMHIDSTLSLPRPADVVVIGGGVVSVVTSDDLAPAATGAGTASKTAMRASCRWQQRASILGKDAPEDRRAYRISPLRHLIADIITGTDARPRVGDEAPVVVSHLPQGTR